MLKVACCIFHAELILLWRRSHEWLYPLAFFLIVISLFPLAFTPDPVFLQKYIPGCIWIAALFASILSIENIFFSDLEEGYLEQLMVSPVPLTISLSAKLCAQWIATQLPLILLTPIVSLFFHLSATTTFAICVSLLFGTPILILLGSLGVALTLGLRQQGVLLGLLILPLATPVLIVGVNVAQQAQATLSIAGPLAFLAGLSVLAITFMPWTIAATLRVSLDN